MANCPADLLRMVARLYYIDELGQSEVAEIAGISRPQVSRLLARARETGIVRITVEDYPARDLDLERELLARFHLKHAVVVRTQHPVDPDSVRRAVGYFAAPPVSELMNPGAILGVAGGRTVYELASRMRAVSGVEGVSVVQLMGNIGPSVSHTDAIEISRVLAGKLQGIFYTVNAPAFAEDAGSRHVYLAHQNVRSVWRLFGAMQLALVGIGTLRDSLFIARATLTPKDLGLLREQGAVGEICGRYFDGNGRECATEFRDRVISIGLDELARCPEVVAVTHGADRAEAILAGLAGSLISSLVIDETCARALLASAG